MAIRQLLFPALILLLAAVIRFTELDIKPPHFDEGINGWFCDQMAQNGYFAYDPTNYHGPFHFYVLFVSLKLLGRNLWALRLPVVLASLLTIFWMFLFRPFFSRTVCYLAALGMALSPGFIFYNRYSIHESWLVFFLILACWGIFGVWTSRKARYFWGLILGLTGMILTKETYIIHVAAFAGAGCVSLIWKRFSKEKQSTHPTGPLPIKQIAAAVLVGIFLIVFFYSGNFLNWKGLRGLYETFLPWTHTGIDSAGHGKPTFDLFALIPSFMENVPGLRGLASLKVNWYWVRLLLAYEWFALAGLIFSLRFLFGGRPALRFLAVYSLAVLFAYSVVPYKTPWCIISIAWPFLFLAGALIEFVANRIHPTVAAVVGVPLFAQAAWKSYDLNFVRYDNPKEMYVYVQTVRDYHKFIDPILEKAAKDPNAIRKLSGAIFLSSYYPIPWVLGDFSRVAYYGKEGVWPQDCDADFVAIDQDKADDLEKHLKDRYFTVDFQLRDGMDDCRAYFRFETFRDIFPDRQPDFDPAHLDE
jgi:uncharacterized protein (TIGR03663 family)